MSEPPSFDLEPEHDIASRSGVPKESAVREPPANHPTSDFFVYFSERVIHDLIMRQLQQHPPDAHGDKEDSPQQSAFPSDFNTSSQSTGPRQFHMSTRHFVMHGWIERPVVRMQSGALPSTAHNLSSGVIRPDHQPYASHEDQSLRFICDCFGGIQDVNSGRIFSLSGIVRIDFRPRCMTRGGHWLVGLLFDHLDLDDVHITYGDGPVPTQLLQEAHAAFANFRVEFRRTFIDALEDFSISYAIMHSQLPMTRVLELPDSHTNAMPLIPFLSPSGKPNVSGLALYTAQPPPPTGDQYAANSTSTPNPQQKSDAPSDGYGPGADHPSDVEHPLSTNSRGSSGSPECIDQQSGSANTPMRTMPEMTNPLSSFHLEHIIANHELWNDLISKHPGSNMVLCYPISDIQHASLAANSMTNGQSNTTHTADAHTPIISALLRECTIATDSSRLHQIVATLQPLIQPLMRIQLLVPGTNIDYMAVPATIDILGDMVVAFYIIPDHTHFQPLTPALKPEILLTLQGANATEGNMPSHRGTAVQHNPGPDRDIWRTTLLKPSYAPYDYYWRTVHQSRNDSVQANRSPSGTIAGFRVSNNVLIDGAQDIPDSEVRHQHQYLIDWHEATFDPSRLDDPNQHIPLSSTSASAVRQIAVTVIDCYGQTAQTLRQLSHPAAPPLAAAKLREISRTRTSPSTGHERYGINRQRAGIVAVVALAMLIVLCRATMALTKLPLGIWGSASQQRISQLQPTLTVGSDHPATPPPFVDVPQPTTPPTALPVILPTPRPAPTPTLRPPPQPTHTPIPTPIPVLAFAIAHTTYTQVCDANLSPLASLAITLDNSRSTVPVNWNITIQQLAPNTAHLWAVAAPAQGTIPAHGTEQIMLQPAPTLCSALVNMAGTPQNLTFNAPLVISGLSTNTPYTLSDSIQPPTMQLVATPAAYAVTCSPAYGALAPSAFVLDNSASSINIQWTATVIGTFATTTGAQPWASLNLGTGTIAAGQHGSITVTPAPTICQALFSAGAAPAQTYTINVIATPAATNAPNPQPTAAPSIIAYTINPPPVNALAITANPLTQTCPVAPNPTTLNPIAIQFDNSKSTVAVSWTLAIDPSTLLPTGIVWASVPAGQTTGIVPAGGTMTVTLTPLVNLCTFVTTSTDFTVTITTQPAGAGPVVIKETIAP